MSAFFAKLHAWWAHLWSHAVQGTLPDVPQANQPVTFPHIVTVTPPAPALPDTHTTPPVQAQAPAPQIEPVMPPAPLPIEFKGFSQPDADGLVTLTDNEAWAGHRLQVEEISRSQTGDPAAKAVANLIHANGLYYPDTPRASILACYEATVGPDGIGIIDSDRPIMGSVNFPGKIGPDGMTDLSKAAGVRAWCDKIKPPGANALDPHGHVPGA